MWIDFIAIVLVLLKILLMILSVVFFVSGADDFFVDVCYYVARVRDKLRPASVAWPSEHDLLAKEEQPIAVMVPAWDESGVIRSMLLNTLRTVRYSNYHIFVGSYPNDPATSLEIEKVREQHRNVHRIVCPKNGPTSKADCLNWVVKGIELYERENGVRFEIVVMDDAEDVLHPLYLKLMNWFVPALDMVQIPVVPLEHKWHRFTGGHYLDEFAECHSKDVLVRNRLTGSVPSAGVGTALSRHSLAEIARRNRNQVFSVDSLTEDYDLGFRFKQLALKQAFICYALETQPPRRDQRGRARRRKSRELIAVREFFPSQFRSAVRQKGRWIVGIALQGWASLGWQGDFWTKYILFRDRKSLITTQASFLGYLIVPVVVAIWCCTQLSSYGYRYPPLVEIGSWVWYLIWANTFFLALRLLQRAFFVYGIYGAKQAFLSVPRQVWANVVNFRAGQRAMYLFARYLMKGKLIAWDKTAHVYPSDHELRNYHRHLGDLLLDRRLITVSQLEEGLREHKDAGEPLGCALVRLGHIREEDLIALLASQLRVPCEVESIAVDRSFTREFPFEMARQYGVLPGPAAGEELLLHVTCRFTAVERQTLERTLRRSIRVCFTTADLIRKAVEEAYGSAA